MEFINRYKYAFIVILVLVLFGVAYLYYITEGRGEIPARDEQELEEYAERLKSIKNLRTQTDLFESKLYLSLTDEFEEDIIEVRIGKVNPFDPREN